MCKMNKMTKKLNSYALFDFSRGPRSLVDKRVDS